MKQRFQLSKIATALAVVGGVSFFGSSAMAATIPATAAANAVISNAASATYTDSAGVERSVNSNLVVTTVAQVGSFTLTTDKQIKSTTKNSKVSYSHILTNTGNGLDSFTVSLANLTAAAGSFGSTPTAGTEFDYNSYKVFLDTNKDGIPDSDVALKVTDKIELKAQESVGLVVVVTTPNTATTGGWDHFTLTATSSSSDSIYNSIPEKSKSNTDRTLITEGAVIELTKAASVSAIQATDSSNNASKFTYTLTFKNTGNAAATDAVIFDKLPDGLVYVAASAKLNNVVLTDGAATESIVNADFQQNGQNVYLKMPTLSPGQLFTLTFDVTVKTGAKSGDVIKNTAYADPDGKDPSNTPITPGTLPSTPENDPTTFPSNPNIVTVVGKYQGSINDAVANPFKDGQTVVGYDDTITVAAKDGLPTLFGTGAEKDNGSEVIYVHNTGDSTDTFNLTFDRAALAGTYDALPAGSVVTLYKADGSTLVTSSKADGILDTGPIPANANLAFVVKVTLPTGQVLSNPAGLKLVSTSVNAGTSDSIKLIINGNTLNKVDLTTIPTKGGSELGTGSNDGTVKDSKSTNPAVPVEFDVTIRNKGNIADNYNITVSGIPDGWVAAIYKKDPDTGLCTGEPITNSGSIQANNTNGSQFCLKVTPPAGAPATNIAQQIKVGVYSPATKTSDEILYGVTVNEQRKLSFVQDQEGQVAPGGTIVYVHTLTNTGNVTEALTTKTLKLTVTDSGNGEKVSAYFDVNRDGKLDTGDILINDSVTATSLQTLLSTYSGTSTHTAGLQQGESVKILVKVEASATATDGTSYISNIKITPDTLANAPTVVFVNDLTTVNTGAITVSKLQAVGVCGSTPSSYSTDPKTAKPGDCVFYKVTATNVGSAEAKNVVISDVVPSYTTLTQSSALGGVGTAAPSNAGITVGPDVATGRDKIKYAAGNLTSAQNATLQFNVKVDDGK